MRALQARLEKLENTRNTNNESRVLLIVLAIVDVEDGRRVKLYLRGYRVGPAFDILIPRLESETEEEFAHRVDSSYYSAPLSGQGITILMEDREGKKIDRLS